MHVRVVRFTDVDPERVEQLLKRVNESGPPPGVPVKSVTIAVDAQQRTAVVSQYFDSAQDMEAGGRAFGEMDASETPGTRASVDECEIKAELSAS